MAREISDDCIARSPARLKRLLCGCGDVSLVHALKFGPDILPSVNVLPGSGFQVGFERANNIEEFSRHISVESFRLDGPPAEPEHGLVAAMPTGPQTPKHAVPGARVVDLCGERAIKPEAHFLRAGVTHCDVDH